MQAFYDAITPRAEEAIAYCDKFPLDDLPEDVAQPAAPAVLADHGVVPGRGWRQPHVPDSGAAYLDCVVEPRPMSDATVLRADRWVDVDAGEVRSPAVDRRRGRPHRGGESR